MNTLGFSALVWLGSVAAGFLGALTGLGGGVVIVPLLAVAFRVDIRYAIGASLVSVIATSCGAAATYVREGYTNLRIGMFLEIATTVGALAGAFLTMAVPAAGIAIVLGLVLIWSAFQAGRARRPQDREFPPDPLATRLKMNSSFPTPEGLRSYNVRSVPGGFAVMCGAGVLSGLLGIGSGAMKVLAMDQIMKMPFKVSTATSNFMIGVTAAASMGVYLGHGYIAPGLAAPVVLGVLPGSLAGTRVLKGAPTKVLRIVFAVVIAFLGVQVLYNGLSGRF